MAPSLSVEIWSDVVCPWCYVGKRRFEVALARFAHRERVAITWRSFELDPSAPRFYEGQGTYAERLAKKYRQSVAGAQQMIDRMTATAAAEGLDFDFGKAKPGNTFDAHRLLHFALAHGRQGEMKERLLRASFTEGAPIGDQETLVRLATEVGLDEEQARAALLSDDYAGDVRADEELARQIGISGVPFFVIGQKYAVSGAQSPDVLHGALEKAWGEDARLVTLGGGPGCDGEVCTE